MSQKKRVSNPIRITLTEDQISDIIQSAAKTRRGLKVESLEDRIAPSAIGAPMFGDPTGPGLPPSPDLPPTNVDPINPDMPPTHVDPINDLPPTNVDPIDDLPPTNVDPIENDLPPTNVDPLNPPDYGDAPVGFQTNLPPGSPEPSGDVPMVGGDQPPVHDPHSGLLDNGTPDASGQHDPIPQQPGNDPAPVPPTPNADGASMPSSEEIEEHRRNILRQLRGN